MKIRIRKRKKDGGQLESGLGWDRMVQGVCRFFFPTVTVIIGCMQSAVIVA